MGERDHALSATPDERAEKQCCGGSPPEIIYSANTAVHSEVSYHTEGPPYSSNFFILRKPVPYWGCSKRATQQLILAKEDAYFLLRYLFLIHMHTKE